MADFWSNPPVRPVSLPLYDKGHPAIRFDHPYRSPAQKKDNNSQLASYAWRMTILSISAAAHAAGIDRRTLQRAIKSGRLSAATNAAGERGVDLAELIRVFGPLRKMPQGVPQGHGATLSQDAAGAGAALLEALRDQVRQSQEQLRQAHEREQQAQQEKAQLLELLEAEQQARRHLEIKLLPAPISAPVRSSRLWWLVVLLVVLAFAGWQFRDMIVFAAVP